MNHQEIPKDDSVLQTAFHIYQSSDQTMALISEQNRTVFAENFEIKNVLPLSIFCLKVIGQTYKIHPYPITNLKIKTINQLRSFYDYIDPNLPIEKCLYIDDDYYWKRVYSFKCTDKMLLKQNYKRIDICWKNLAISLKYTELIENTPYERWISEDMEKITEFVSPYVTELNIRKLQPMRESSFGRQLQISSIFSKSSVTISDEENRDNKSKTTETIGSRYDFPFEDCHHVDLSVLGGLLQLHSLTVEFVPQKLTSNYHNRFFNFSYVDIQNLARGISKLKNLRSFKLRRSRMDSVKLFTILEALHSIFVEELEFYFCQLDDDCGESIHDYLVSTKSLINLDLSGNYFKQEALYYLSRGIQKSHTKLSFLGLSNNPFSAESLCNLTKSLEVYEHLKVLKLSGIQCNDIGASGITNLVKNNSNLVELHIIAVRMNGAGLIQALKSNHQIQQIICQGCGLTLEEEFKVEILLERNRYIKLNPYIGDITKTEEEINAFLRKSKNAIFVKSLEDAKERSECLKHKSLRYVDVEQEKSLLD